MYRVYIEDYDTSLQTVDFLNNGFNEKNIWYLKLAW